MDVIYRSIGTVRSPFTQARGGLLTAFENDLSEFVTANNSIQFPLEKPLPLTLIKESLRTAFERVSRKTGNGKRNGKS